MKKSRLILRNLWFYRKPWLSVFAGATISIAVLTGALTVGDSVRFSLQRLTDVRLGKTKFILQSKDHLFRDSLADGLSAELKESVAPVLLSEGVAINSDKGKRINRTEVIGIDTRFPDFWDGHGLVPGEDEAVISRNTAEKLDLQVGDEFLLRMRKQSGISRNAPFAADKESSVSLRVKVKAIAEEEHMGRFSLKSNQAEPYNVFISLKQMNKILDLKAKANVLLLAGDSEVIKIDTLDGLLSGIWQPSDIGMKIEKLPGSGQYEITSERVFMDSTIAAAVRSSIPGCSGILTYLANSLNYGSRSVPYSFVAATDELFYSLSIVTSPSLKKERGTEGVSMPGNRGIIINKWLAEDLQAAKGDSLWITHYIIGPYFSLSEKSASFLVSDIIAMDHPLCDPSLMPDFPGISGTDNCRDWETATPVNLERIRDKDEKYWKEFRGTPKAFISLRAGQELWKNAFGNHTAFRFRADGNQIKGIEEKIMQGLEPSEQGFLFVSVFEEGKSAAAESTDFGTLFLGLSFFIIVSGLLLMGIIFSVHAYSRLTETAVLSSMGFRKKQVLSILLSETLLVILLAGITGLLLGIGYNRLMLLGLNTLWQDSVRTSSLHLHLHFASLAAGAVAGMIMAFMVLMIVLYRKMKDPLAALLHSASSPVYKVQKPVFKNHSLSFSTLVLKNTRLNPKRTIGAIVLLAIGTFTIIITGANRRIFPDAPTDRESGTGGFLFWAESTIPIIYDLNTVTGKKQFAMEQDTLFSDVRFLHIHTLDGDDASCLNLNRVEQPALLGIDASQLDQISAFSFKKIIPSLPHSFSPSVLPYHPWKLLQNPLSDGVIAGIADQTVIKWGLGRSVGDTLVYFDGSGKPLKIVLVAGLDNSIFQGNILIDDSLFRVYFPSAEGSKTILIDGPFGKKQRIGEEMEQIFRDYGMVVTPTAQRLDEFNSVQNTYLSVFMLLGGLGVIIGTFGLGFLLVRNLQERRHEIALYFALGFRKKNILCILVAEHLLILISGIIAGTLIGLAAIIPSLLSPATDIPVAFLIIMITAILLTGLLWILIPVRSAFREDVSGVLRREA